MSLSLVTYSDAKYAAQQERLFDAAVDSGQFVSIHSFGREWLTNQMFYLENKELLDEATGAGFWAWKHFVVLSALEIGVRAYQMKENDVLLYMDCGDVFIQTDGLRDFLEKRMENTDILLTNGAFPNRDWTRRDAFILLECDEKKYWDATQVEAGIIVIKNTAASREFIAKWGAACLDRRIVSDDENVCGFPNFPGFKEGRRDQSILGLLAQREMEGGGPCKIERGHEMRNYIDCNRND